MDNYKMTDFEADNLVTSIKMAEQEKLRFNKIAKDKIQNVELMLADKINTLDGEIQFKKDQLTAFFLTVDKKDSKTQQSYSLLSGKLVMKKATQKIVHDDVLFMDWAWKHKLKYVEVKQVNKLDWAGLKKDFSIVNGMILDNATGEILEGIEGLFIEDIAPQFDIK